MCSQMMHPPSVLKMLLVIGGVEQNPGPKTRIQEDPGGLSSLEESVGNLSLKHEITSPTAKLVVLIKECQTQILFLQTQVSQLTTQQKEDRSIIASLQKEVLELKSCLQNTKAQTAREYVPTNSEKLNQCGNKPENKEHTRLQVNNQNWTSVVHSLAHIWVNHPVAHTQLQQVSPDEQYPLLTVCKRGYTDLVEVLLDLGMDPNTVAYDTYGDTLLHIAVYSGQVSLARMLLARGADIEQREQFGFTPLISAARAGQVTTVQLLTNRGANINATTHNGQTSLHWAASLGHSAVAFELVDHGANATTRDKIEGNTAEGAARAAGYHEIANYIATHCH